MQFADFLDAELASLLRFARVLTGDRGIAEDVVQDVIGRLWERPELFAALDSPLAYVRRMIVNQYLSWGRKWFRVRPSDRVSSSPVGVDPADIVADRDELHRALTALPRNQRAVLVLRYYLGLGDDEIARSLGCGESTVRSHASRALATLRVSLPSTDRSGHGASQP